MNNLNGIWVGHTYEFRLYVKPFDDRGLNLQAYTDAQQGYTMAKRGGYHFALFPDHFDRYQIERFEGEMPAHIRNSSNPLAPTAWMVQEIRKIPYHHGMPIVILNKNGQTDTSGLHDPQHISFFDLRKHHTKKDLVDHVIIAFGGDPKTFGLSTPDLHDNYLV